MKDIELAIGTLSYLINRRVHQDVTLVLHPGNPGKNTSWKVVTKEGGDYINLGLGIITLPQAPTCDELHRTVMTINNIINRLP